VDDRRHRALHDRGWKRDTLTALWAKLEKALEQRGGSPVCGRASRPPALDADWLRAQIRARAEKRRKSKHFADSARWLLLLKDSPAWDDEARFGYGLATLKSHRHPLGTAARPRDPSLEAFRALADSAFPLADRLRRERAVDPEDAYYVAFALAELRGEPRSVAAEILGHLADKYGRTKVGKAAKNKLQLLNR
jgi:hypothetical protein